MNNNYRGQSLMELVVGMGLITVVLGAVAVVTVNTLKNTQFSKNQVQATKYAQENLEKVRTIKNTNFGICTQSQTTNCSGWQDVWAHPFFGSASNCTSVGCTYVLVNNCNAPAPTGGFEIKPFCLRYSAWRAYVGASGSGFTAQITIEDEAVDQKRVTSRVFWSDSSGEHSSDLVTIFSKR